MNGCVVVDAARTVKTLLPVRQFHTFDSDLATFGGGMNELIVAQINADMREAAFERVVKYQIAGL